MSSWKEAFDVACDEPLAWKHRKGKCLCKACHELNKEESKKRMRKIRARRKENYTKPMNTVKREVKVTPPCKKPLASKYEHRLCKCPACKELFQASKKPLYKTKAKDHSKPIHANCQSYMNTQGACSKKSHIQHGELKLRKVKKSAKACKQFKSLDDLAIAITKSHLSVGTGRTENIRSDYN